MGRYDELRRLLASYVWLRRELEAMRKDGRDAVALEQRLGEAFVGILQFRCDSAAVTRHQVEFLVTLLAEGGHDAESRALMRDAILRHVATLSVAAVASPSHEATAAHMTGPPDRCRS